MIAIITCFNRRFHWNLLSTPQKSTYRVHKMGWFFMKPKCERDFEKAHKRVKGKLKWKQANYHSARERWIKPFQLEEQFGVAILQRQHRLITQQLEMKRLANVKQGGEQSARRYWTTTTQFWKSISPSYRKYTGSIRVIWVGTAICNRWVSLPWKNKWYSEHIETDTVVFTHGCWIRKDVLPGGGCCGRPCRCCEKALGQYLQPAKGDGQSELVKVYGHCTVECACCIKYRGCYVPDPCLPPPVLKLWEGCFACCQQMLMIAG